MTTIDLNCDMGESFGAYKLGRDEDFIKFISSANIWASHEVIRNSS